MYAALPNEVSYLFTSDLDCIEDNLLGQKKKFVLNRS